MWNEVILIITLMGLKHQGTLSHTLTYYFVVDLYLTESQRTTYGNIKKCLIVSLCPKSMKTIDLPPVQTNG
jgi:hypothetical protein